MDARRLLTPCLPELMLEALGQQRRTNLDGAVRASPDR
jgi:hypothetical protein